MNEFLAELYGTAPAGSTAGQESSLEKTAAVEVLSELSGEDLSGVDWDDYSVEEIKDVIDELYEKTASVGEAEEPDLDFFGRAAAHAFCQELELIEEGLEKSAAPVPGGIMSGVKKAKDWIFSTARHGKGADAFKKAWSGVDDAIKPGIKVKGKKVGEMAGTSLTGMERLKHLGEAAKNFSPELGAAGAAGLYAASGD